MSADPTLNLNDTTPSAPAGKTNVKWQADGPTSDPRNVSAYVDTVIEAQFNFTDITTANVSTAAHGLAPKAPNDVTKFFRGDATYAVPPTVTISAPGYAPTLPNDATKYLDGTGNYSVPPSGNGFSALSGYRNTAYIAGGDDSGGLNGNGLDSLGEAANHTQGSVFNTYTGPSSSPKRAAATTFSTVSANTNCGLRGVANKYLYGTTLNFFCSCYIKRATDVREWLGMFSNNGTNLGDSPAAAGIQCVAFRFSTIAGDTQWQAVASDGSSNTIVASGVTGDTASHVFLIVCNDSVPNAKFYIDGVLVATITTHLPTAGQAIGFQAGAQWASASPGEFFGFSQVAIQTTP